LDLDTACSSGVVALDLACQGLWNKRTDAAIVAGANLILSPEMNISLSSLNFLSKDGRCFSFDHRANGYARGEGFAVLVLKPLSKALADGHKIRALIRSVGSNQDGRTTGGMMYPSREMQAELIRETYKRANLDMSLTAHFESHGTGTNVGDPTEARALGEAFAPYRSRDNPLYIGALKGNIGHLEGASGLASIIKVVLAMERGVIPPNTNFEKLNPKIDDKRWNLKFPQESIPWPRDGVRRASVNSFGFGGANAHVVLDDACSGLKARGLHGHYAPQPTNTKIIEENNEQTSSPTPALLVFSASDEAGINRQAQAHSQYLQQHAHAASHELLSNISFTLATYRTRLNWSSFCVVSTQDDIRNLPSLLSPPSVSLGSNPRLGLIFTGQGAAWEGMAQELLDEETFKNSILRSEKHLIGLGCNWSLFDLLVNQGKATSVDVNEAQYSQVLCTAIQIALIDLLYWVGTVPSIVVGHSSGEIAAAYAAGHISAAAAMKIAYYRGLLGAKLEASSGQKWGMAAIGLSKEETDIELAQIDGPEELVSLAVSCINSPSNVTISGPEHHLDALVSRLQGRQIFARKLKVTLGYHSPQMNQISGEYLSLLGNLESGSSHEGAPLMVSTVTADIIDRGLICSAKYWVRNMVSAVDFLGAMRLSNTKTFDAHPNGWLEIGPHSALKGPLRQILKSLSRETEVVYTSALVRHVSALSSVLSAAGHLHCNNFAIDLSLVTQLGLSSNQVSSRTMLSDLPSYQFNHTTRYLSQSPSATNFRLRTNGNHDLLGTQIGDPNEYEAQWKFLIREDDMPWVRDHKVNGVILYPAAGMLVMAIEAAKQLMNDTPPPAFELDNVEIPAPINLSSHEGVEVRIHLSALSESKIEDQAYRFRIFLCQKDNAHEIVCRGNIRGDWPNKSSDVYTGTEEAEREKSANVEYKEAMQSCTNALSQEQMYQVFLDTTRFEYGSSFQPLSEVQFDHVGHAIATLESYDAGQWTSPHIVHPTRLDGLFQLCLSALHGMGRATTLVPTRVGKMWLSVSGFGHASPSHIVEKAFVKARTMHSRTVEFDVKTLDSSTLELKAWINALELTSVASTEGESSDPTTNNVENLCWNVEWEVDFGSMSDYELHRYCEQTRLPKAEEPAEWFESLANLMILFGAKALYDIEKDDSMKVVSLERYTAWLRHHTRKVSASAIPEQHVLDELCEPFLKSKLAETYITVAKSLKGILVGTVDQLDLLFGGDSRIAEFYIALSEMGSGFASLDRYLRTLTHKFPNLKFLEVGGGTGGVTSFVINSIANQESGAAFEQYMFTDISPFFFDKARKRFAEHDRRMKYAALDIEKDPLMQGFELGEYDIIIADNVLHATADLCKTLKNVRKLLKPGGKLLLRELIAPDQVLTGFMFGLLPGWWLSEENFRQTSPVITEETWDGVLKTAGFSGTDIVFRDHLDATCHLWSIIVTTAVHTPLSTDSHVVVSPDMSSPTFILDSKSSLQTSLAKSIGEVIELQGTPLNTASLAAAARESTQHPNTRDFIFLYEVEQPLLGNISADSLNLIRSLLQSARSVLWMKLDIPSDPSYSISDGLCRVARHENPNIHITTLSISPTFPLTPGRLSHIAYVFQAMQSAIRTRSRDVENEYTSSGNDLSIPRLRQAGALNSHIHCLTKRPVLLQTLGHQKLKLGTQAPGLLDKLCFSQDNSFNLVPLGADEIEIEVCAFGVNFKDCLTLLGRVKTDVLGLECAGIVRSVGSSITDFQPGDRVAVGALDSFKTFLRCHSGNVAKIPDSMSITEAAAVPIAYSTVYYSLIQIARLQAGEKLLIHAAAGGTGQAALQMAQYIGAEVFCTVGSETKKKLLMEVYMIPEDHIFYSRDTSFADGIKRMTKNGVDVILNSTSGRLMEASWDCIAPFGRFVEIGLKDAIAGNNLPMAVFTRNATFSAVDMTAILLRTDGSMQRLMTKVFELFKQGKLRAAHPLHVYPISETEQAFRFLQSGKSSGKIVLEVDPEAKLPIVQGPFSDYSFEAGATYVIAGGLGGLGRSIARWLSLRGARNLILISRSGPDGKPEAQDLLSDMAKAGVTVQCPRCDIANLSALQAALAECSETLPPIRGCFQASMVLRVSSNSPVTHKLD
jgi:acyl transferase domain-containing protein/NADPH:quinone reductase-like Zn-dependent oxidoreductase/ubiquinone/menaquinone biosynthesis C-methylase UbiE